MGEGEGKGAVRGQNCVRSRCRFPQGVRAMTPQQKLDIQTLLEWHLAQMHQLEEEGGSRNLIDFHDTASDLLWGLVK